MQDRPAAWRVLARALLLLLAGCCPQEPASSPGSAAEAQPAAESPSGIAVLQFDEQAGEPVADVLELMQELLGLPVDYVPEEVAELRLHVLGAQRVRKDRLYEWFESLLAQRGVLIWEDASGGSTRLVARAISKETRLDKLPCLAPPLVELEDLAAGRVPRSPVFTVAFPLRHVHARDQLVLLSRTLDATYESVRCAEGSNVAVITATRAHLLAIRDLFAAIDVPPLSAAADADLGRRLGAVEKRLDEIEARLPQ
jgi:hypothetical protein